MPSKVTRPLTSAPPFGNRPMMASEVTLLPQPDSPTMPSVLPRSDRKAHPVDGEGLAPVRARKDDPQVLDRQERPAHSAACAFSAAIASAMSRSISARSVTPAGLLLEGMNLR